MSNQCEHGQLARVCSTCEFEREIKTLRTELTLEREHCERLERRLELQQEAANRYSAKVAELDRLNTDLAMESHALQDRVAELEALVREAADYLDYNKQTSIGHGSILHQKFRAASTPQEDQQ